MSHILENTALANFDSPHQVPWFSPPETHVLNTGIIN